MKYHLIFSEKKSKCKLLQLCALRVKITLTKSMPNDISVNFVLFYLKIDLVMNFRAHLFKSNDIVS